MDMKILGKRNLSLTLISLVVAGALIVAGCSGGGGTSSSSGTTGGDTGNTNPYSGAAKISGGIDVSGLSSSDTSLLTKTLPKRLLKGGQLRKQLYSVDYTTDAIAKLYVVGDDGSLTDTGIEGTLSTDTDGNPTYSFDGVKDGLTYIVRYLKLVGNGQALELKGDVTVPEGATEPDGDATISPKTSVVVETLISAILDATNGTGISQDTVNKIISAVKSAIQTLVDSGAIQIPSMVVAASGSDITEIASSTTQNNDLANASGVLLSDDSVGAELGVVKAQTQADLFNMSDLTTDDAKRAFILKVFKELVSDKSDDSGGVPSFMVKFFSDKYIEGTTKTVGQIMDAIAAGLIFQPGITPPDITKSAAITAFKDKLTRIYTLLDKKDAGTITDDEKKELADVKPILLGLFPIAEREGWSNLSASTSLNVPQGIAMTVYIIDVYIAEVFSDLQATYTATDAGGGAGVSYQKERPYDFNPLVPGSLMDLLGFYSVYQNYTGYDINNLWIHPGRAWIESSPGNGTEVDMLSAGSCLSDVASMVKQFRPDLPVSVTDISSASATLTYPKGDGTTGTIALVSEASLMGNLQGPGGMETCFVLDPWREATAGVDPSTISGPVPLDQSRIVSDFTSGTYTVTITIGSDTVTKSFTKRVVTGMTKVYATLVTPAGFPNWPGNGATQAEMDAFNASMTAFQDAGGPTRFAANVDTNGDGENDAAKIVITWNAPTVTLPDGVKMGYQINLGKGGCDTNGCSWQQIFSTWDRNKMLFTTSFTLPVNLPKQDQTDPQSYQLNLDLIFIDSTTGETLGQGGSAHAEFRVGDPLDKTKTFTITGTAVDGYKVVLFREVENPDSLTNRFTRTAIQEADVTNGTYTLNPTIGDFVDYPKSSFNIVMYQDTDSSGDFSDGDLQVWPDWNAPHIFFNTWGGMLRVGKDVCESTSPDTVPTCQHTETMIFGGETVDGPTFTTPSVGP